MKENEELINKLKNKNEDNIILNEKNKNEIKLIKKEIFNIKIKSKICKIILSSGKICCGFLIKSYRGDNPFYFLISNEINKLMIDNKEKIEINYDNKNIKINLNENERFIRNYKYINIDITIIEILSKDNINEKYFLLPYINNNNNYKNMKIDIIYKEGDDINKINSEIKLINQYKFEYLLNNKNGISVSPIFKEDTKEVIGINKEDNYGYFIEPIINSLKLNLKYEKKEYNNGIYEGEMKNNKFEGYGKYIWENGEYYIGQFVNNLRHGKGILYYNNNIK